MPRWMALDIGGKRTGIAVTDELQIIATGLVTVATADLKTFLTGYFSQNTVSLVVVGLPRQMDNTDSESAVLISGITEKIRTWFPDIPVERYDERFTSSIAYQAISSMGISKEKKHSNKGLVDMVSATILLQDYMEFRKNQS